MLRAAEARAGDAYYIMTDLLGKLQESLFRKRVCALRMLFKDNLYRDAIINPCRKICKLKIG
jgi:hypothetical protein